MQYPCLTDVDITLWTTGLNFVKRSTSSSMYNVKIHTLGDNISQQSDWYFQTVIRTQKGAQEDYI